MNFDQYQQEAARTGGCRHDFDRALSSFSLGLAGESGEICDHVKKYLGHGHPLDRDKVVAELGDLLWYVAILAHVLGVNLADVAQGNLSKLRRRYPDGFSTAASLARVDATAEPAVAGEGVGGAQ